MSFIDLEIVRQTVEQEGGNALFSQALLEKLALLVEMETRHVLESSYKFMIKDCRDVIEHEDVVDAVRDHGYFDMIIDELYGRGSDEYFSVGDDSFE
jgi:histone H3/H4